MSSQNHEEHEVSDLNIQKSAAYTTSNSSPPAYEGALVNSYGVSLKAFKRGLRPKYSSIWFSIVCAHLLLMTVGYCLVQAQKTSASLAIPIIVVGAIMFGYVMAYIQLFIHEAAHYNIAENRATNDFLANLFMGIWTGQNIKKYRPIHFDHHRHLGTPRDTEQTYFDELNSRFILEALFGIKVMNVLRKRRLINVSNNRTLCASRAQPILAMALHGAILATAVYQDYWILFFSWIIGMGSIFPFLAALRQLLEHRGKWARANVDYNIVEHGAYARIFGHGPLAATFGGAGFNLHLLHHWEPQISCTRLKELEAYLMDTELFETLQRSNSSYTQTFRNLYSPSTKT